MDEKGDKKEAGGAVRGHHVTESTLQLLKQIRERTWCDGGDRGLVLEAGNLNLRLSSDSGR